MPKKIILLADDEKMVADVTQAMLTQLGYEVIVAEDGNKAVELFKQNRERIGLAIIDYNMPGLDGLECVQAIREISDVPILISSGYGSNTLETILTENQVQGVIQKPFALDDLRKKIGRFF